MEPLVEPAIPVDLGFDAADPDIFAFDADFGFDAPLVDLGLDLLRVP